MVAAEMAVFDQRTPVEWVACVVVEHMVDIDLVVVYQIGSLGVLQQEPGRAACSKVLEIQGLDVLSPYPFRCARNGTESPSDFSGRSPICTPRSWPIDCMFSILTDSAELHVLSLTGQSVSSSLCSPSQDALGDWAVGKQPPAR